LNNPQEQLFIEYYGCSDIGLVRSENQDSFGKYPPDDNDLYTGKGQLFIVADGMGGHAGGRIASNTAVESILNYFSKNSSADIEKFMSRCG
jgi:serine/threonine protein phosphatase PrpC